MVGVTGGWPHVVLLAGAAIGLVFLLTRAGFYRRVIGAATPGQLGAIRSFVCLVLLASVLWEDVPSTALLPSDLRQPMGAYSLLYHIPGFEAFVRSHAALNIFEWITAGVLFMGVIGYRTRLVIPLGVLFYFVLGGTLRQYCWFYATGLIPIFMMLVLSFTPCGDGWSVDALLKAFRGNPTAPDRPTARYGWSRYAVWCALAIPYGAAGLSKFRNGGLHWWNADNMRYIFYDDCLNHTHFDLGVALHLTSWPDLFYALLGLSAILGELLYPLVLVSLIVRKLFPPVMAMMHGGILLMQNILFPDLIAMQVVWWDFRRTRKKFARRLRLKHGRIRVLYDGRCTFCAGTMRVVHGLDLFERVRAVDYHSVDLASLSLDPDAVRKDMHLLADGRVYTGYDAYRRLARVLPLTCLIAPLMGLQGVRGLGASWYRRTADRRCDDTCAIGMREDSVLARPRLTPRPVLAKPSYRPAILLTAFISLLMFCHLFRVEYFPLTGMQMYSLSRGDHNIRYVTVVAHEESGATFKPRFEEAIRACTDGRFKGAIGFAFLSRVGGGSSGGREKRQHIAAEFLEACGREFNRERASGERIVAFELTLWEWDFHAHPDAPPEDEALERFYHRLRRAD